MGASGTGGIGHKKRPDSISADFTGNALALSPLAAENPGSTAVLEPLIESGVTDATDTIDRKSPRRDWKPNTDVVGAMEAIEGAISINIDYYQLINLLRLAFASKFQ